MLSQLPKVKIIKENKMGKGSSPRPFSVNQDQFAKNYDAIFGKKNEEPAKQPVNEDERIEDTVQDSEQGG